MSPEAIVTTHQQRVADAVRADRWRSLRAGLSTDLAEQYFGPVYDDTEIPSALQRLQELQRR
jgi:hypothetical protein